MLAEVQFLQRDHHAAKHALCKSLAIAGELTDRRYTISNTLPIFSNIFSHLKHLEAMRVFGATHAYLQQVDEHLDRFFLRDSDRVAKQAHQVFDDRAFESAFAEGQTLSPGQALKLALAAAEEM